jgi:hypothetical protein
MATTGRTMNSRVKVADTVDTAREADNGLIVPCIKEPERVRIEQRADEGLLTPCVKEPERIAIDRVADEGLLTPCVKEPERIAIDRVADKGLLVPCIKGTDGFITPCVRDAGGIRFERAVDDGLIVPCVREADAITIAVRGDIFIRGTQAGTNGQILFDNPASDRPFWDQNSRDTYDPAPEVTVSGRSPYYSGDFFLIA